MKKGWITTPKPKKSSLRRAYAPSLGDEPMRMPPHLDLSDADLPDIKDWEVGETYEIALKIKQTSANSSEYPDRPKSYNACFEVTAIKVIGE